MSERIKQPSLLAELSAEFAGTMILILFGCGVVAQVVTSKGGLGVTDLRNNAPVAYLAPFIVGLIVVAIGMAWGTNAGYAINPARDFGPRLVSFITGYGGAFRDQSGFVYFWVPIVGPLIGGSI